MYIYNNKLYLLYNPQKISGFMKTKLASGSYGIGFIFSTRGNQKVRKRPKKKGRRGLNFLSILEKKC